MKPLTVNGKVKNYRMSICE
jgi:hypothetical protein